MWKIKKRTAKAVSSWRLLHSCNAGHNVHIIAERLTPNSAARARSMYICLSRSFVRHALLRIHERMAGA